MNRFEKKTGAADTVHSSAKYKSILLFALSGLVLLTVVSFLFSGYISKGYQYQEVQKKQDELIYADDKKDVLFFGDSIAWAAYSPEIFWKTNGIPTYNCSTSGQWLGDGKIILNSAVEKQVPKIVVWDANSIYTNISRVKYFLSESFPVFHYHFAYLSNSCPHEKDPFRGYNSSDAVNVYTGAPDYMGDAETQPFTSLAADNLEEIYQICKDHHITLVMTCSPNPHTWNMGRHNAVQEWCDSHSVEFIDYNLMTNEIGIDWKTDTRDGGEHLNNNGAYKVCMHLSDYLKDRYDLHNYYNDPAYRDWVKDYGEVES